MVRIRGGVVRDVREMGLKAIGVDPRYFSGER